LIYCYPPPPVSTIPALFLSQQAEAEIHALIATALPFLLGRWAGWAVALFLSFYFCQKSLEFIKFRGNEVVAPSSFEEPPLKRLSD